MQRLIYIQISILQHFYKIRNFLEWLTLNYQSVPITHRFILSTHFFDFTYDFVDGYTDQNGDKHIRQGITDNYINVHQKPVDNKAHKPDDQILNAECTCFFVLL